MKTAEQTALDHGLCRCDEAYTKRGLTAPDCPYHAFSVAEAMEEYASQFQPQWIKINSEADLPDHTNDVIALVANEPIQSYFINGKWMGSYDVRSSVKDGWGGDFELCGQSTVTHWMPLPQPPKED